MSARSCHGKIHEYLRTCLAWSHGRNYWLSCRFKASKNARRRITAGKTSSSLSYSLYNLNDSVRDSHDFLCEIAMNFGFEKDSNDRPTAWPRVRKRADVRGSETNPQKNVYVVPSKRNTLRCRNHEKHTKFGHTSEIGLKYNKIFDLPDT